MEVRKDLTDCDDSMNQKIPESSEFTTYDKLETDKPLEKKPFQRAFRSSVHRFNTLLDSFGIEASGITRIPPAARLYSSSFTHFTSLLRLIFLWMSAACGLSSMSGFFLGPLVFELSFKDSMTAGISGAFFGALFAAYASTMGPRSGLRQMVLTRFIFGWWPARFISFLNVVTLMGWSVVNSVTGGQILASVSNNKVPLEVGITIITCVSLVVAIFGIRYVQIFENYAAIPVALSFLLLYVCASPSFNTSYQSPIIGDSETLRGNWLSFFSVCFGVTAAWAGVTSDYYVDFPEDTPFLESFMITLFCILIPTLFVGILGICIATGGASIPSWNEAYEELGNGGLLNAAYSRWNGGGKFLLVVMFVSLVSNNVINTYSVALSTQMWGDDGESSKKLSTTDNNTSLGREYKKERSCRLSLSWLSKALTAFANLPRWVLVLLSAVIYFACAMGGRNTLAPILNNFLPMIGYWAILYVTIMFEENIFFHRKPKQIRRYRYTHEMPEAGYIPVEDSYKWENWNNKDRLPVGVAAFTSFVIGVVGVVLGMCQVYYVGPIAALIGAHGADIGMWLGAGFTGICYPILRYLELEYAPWSDKDL